MQSVAVELSEEAHRLRPELRDPPDTAAKRHRPHVAAAGFPVGGDDGRHRDEPAFLQVVVDEVLHQELIHIGTAARTRHRPDIVCQHPQRPVALCPASPVPDTYLLLWATGRSVQLPRSTFPASWVK